MFSPPVKYSEAFTLTPEHFDQQGNLLPSTALTLFQRLADTHASLLGLDFDTMLRHRLLWVVTQTKYQALAAVKPGCTIIGTTWPLPPTRIGFEREYMLCSADGAVLIKGTSNWAVIDADSRRLTTMSGIYPNIEHCTDKCFIERVRRLRDFDAAGEAYRVVPNESHIDANGHVNNCHYADFVLLALGGLRGIIDTFQIDYANEVMCHQPLFLWHTDTPDGVLVKGVSEKEQRMFTCFISYN